MRKHSHHNVIVPTPVNERGFPLAALGNETTFLVSPDGSMIVGKNADTDAM